MKFLNNIDLVQNALEFASLHPVSADPAAPVEGQVYFNTTDKRLYVWNDTTWIDLSSEGDIKSVASATGDQLEVENGTGPDPVLSIVTGAIVNGGTALATGDQIYDWVISLNYSTTVGTVTSVAAGDGLVLTGDANVTPTLSVEYTGADNIVLDSTGTATATEDDAIIMSDTGENVVRTTLGTIPVEALAIVKTYIDTSTAGALNFQGGYDAATNIPALEPGNTTLTGSVATTVSVTVTGTGTLFLTELVVGDSILANGETRIIDAIASDTSLTVSVAFTVAGSDPAPERVPLVTGIKKGMMWAVTVDGLFFTEQVRIGDSIIANVDNPIALDEWTTIQSNIDLATTTTVGLASFSADNFAVSAAGEVTVKDNGIALGTETYGDYVQSVTVTDGLLGAVATEAGVAALQLDLGGIQTGSGTDFVMTDSGTGEDSYITPIASAAVLLNPSVTFAASLSATGDVTHNLATRDVIVQLFDTVTFDTVYADVTRTDASKVNVSFAATPTNAVRVLISKVG